MKFHGSGSSSDYEQPMTLKQKVIFWGVVGVVVAAVVLGIIYC